MVYAIFGYAFQQTDTGKKSCQGDQSQLFIVG